MKVEAIGNRFSVALSDDGMSLGIRGHMFHLSDAEASEFLGCVDAAFNDVVDIGEADEYDLSELDHDDLAGLLASVVSELSRRSN